MAYFGALDPASNRADFNEPYGLDDAETGDPIDEAILSAASIVFEIADPVSKAILLSATSDNGLVTIPTDGVMLVTFTRAQMTTLCPGTYNVGITITDDDETEQILAGTIPIYDGVVAV